MREEDDMGRKRESRKQKPTGGRRRRRRRRRNGRGQRRIRRRAGEDELARHPPGRSRRPRHLPEEHNVHVSHGAIYRISSDFMGSKDVACKEVTVRFQKLDGKSLGNLRGEGIGKRNITNLRFHWNFRRLNGQMDMDKGRRVGRCRFF